MSTLNEYQSEAGATNKGTRLYRWDAKAYEFVEVRGVYNALGLGGESGECLEKLKKLVRDGDGGDFIGKAIALKLELGDVLWYLSQLARDFGFTLQDVADANLAKLRSREERGVIHGAGDNR